MRDRLDSDDRVKSCNLKLSSYICNDSANIAASYGTVVVSCCRSTTGTSQFSY